MVPHRGLSLPRPQTWSLPWRAWRHLSPAWRFALLAGLFNSLLFVPFVLLDRVDGRWLPGWPDSVGPAWRWWLMARPTFDLLRWHMEWTALLALILALGGRLRRVGPWLAAGSYALAWLYQIYEAVDVVLYHRQPNWYNDWPFIRDGAAFLVDGLQIPWWQVALALAILASIGWLLVRGMAALWDAASAFGWTRWFAVAGLLAVNVAYLHWGNLFIWADPQAVAQSLVAKLELNDRRAKASRRATAHWDNLDPWAYYDYRAYPLAQKPDVIFIALESYGSILYRTPALRERYRGLMAQFAQRLNATGWHGVTALSEAPVWGGGSWMSYTTLLFGLPVSEQPQYLKLRERFQFEPYPNLGRYFQQQGYQYLWLVPIARQLEPEIAIRIERFYGADEWITFEDLNYHGPLYGWGPSPPDQYTLGFLLDRVQHAPDSQPRFVFYLTQNTHYPFAPLPPRMDDWRALNDPSLPQPPKPAKKVEYKQALNDYIEALAYDLDLLATFIEQWPNPNAIFILVGDHQPPAISARRHGYSTPLHIISRDAAFLAQWEADGFTPGFWLEDPEPRLKHAGFYSLLVRHMVARYGVDPDTLPPYYPEGLPVPTTEVKEP
ncbi:MAG: sulfatase-like hydrolase/transferase [Chloroflexi bacterium]|nr:sulfatase-like hydrolase/transferase [Chloroflexota bacterium]